jgi:hypothetical protein
MGAFAQPRLLTSGPPATAVAQHDKLSRERSDRTTKPRAGSCSAGGRANSVVLFVARDGVNPHLGCSREAARRHRARGLIRG